MPLLPFKSHLPKIADSVFIASNAYVIGDVEIGEGSGVWFSCTLRGDVNDIRIGRRTNIQDGTVIHVATETQGTYIGDDVTVGHMALIHACTIGSRVLIGMQACVMDGAVVEDEAMVAAGSLVTPGKRVPSRQLWAGAPARYVRELTPQEVEFLKVSADRYSGLARTYLNQAQSP